MMEKTKKTPSPNRISHITTPTPLEGNYRKRTFWDRFGIIGTLASIIGAVIAADLFLHPPSSSIILEDKRVDHQSVQQPDQACSDICRNVKEVLIISVPGEDYGLA